MNRIKLLLSKYLSNTASEEEVREMLLWLRENEEGERMLEAAWRGHKGTAPAADLGRMWMNIEAATLADTGEAGGDVRGDGAGRRKTGLLLWRWQAAAVLVLVLAGGWYWARVHKDQQHLIKETATVAAKEIGPGRNGAILTLADGSRVSLDSLGKGVIVRQQGASVVARNGGVAYEAGGEDLNGKGREMVYNSVSTPNGRQYKLVLPDGTRVWLNAASSIRFPTVFREGERRVDVTGEVYFEVAKDPRKPFFVRTGDAEVAVLGTEFNVNGYKEEDVVRTTLISGSVAIGKSVLKPGEQARVAAGKQMVVVHDVDVDQVIAWKNGAFNFQNMGLREVMRQLARWYDLEIVYEKDIPEVAFGGEMSRNVSLADLLDGLKDMGIHFKVEAGRRLVVTR